MKKMLFISNVSNRITNFSIPSIVGGQSLGYEFHMAANYSEFVDDETKYRVTLHHIDLTRKPFSPKNIIAYKQMLNLIKKEKFDVIHCNTPIGGILGRICGKKGNVSKIIYTVHGFHFYKGAPLINQILFKWVEMWLARYTDAIITINQEDYYAARKFKLREGGKVYCIPGVGIETSIIREANSKRREILEDIGADNDSILIISLGELNKNKNNEVIVNALGKLQDPKIHYLLCGVGDKKDELIDLAKKNNMERYIHFLGYRTDVPQMLKSCDIFVMPSYREGLSRSIMEAMSAGLPCIVSNIRGNVDLIENEKGGFLINPYDMEGFAKAINILTADSNLRNTMGYYNIKRVAQFDIENVKLKIKEIYKNVLT